MFCVYAGISLCLVSLVLAGLGGCVSAIALLAVLFCGCCSFDGCLVWLLWCCLCLFDTFNSVVVAIWRDLFGVWFDCFVVVYGGFVHSIVLLYCVGCSCYLWLFWLLSASLLFSVGLRVGSFDLGFVGVICGLFCYVLVWLCTRISDSFWCFGVVCATVSGWLLLVCLWCVAVTYCWFCW